MYIGVLIGQSSSNYFNNVKLSTSGNLNVQVFNSFGIYTYVNISVQVNDKNKF